MFNFSIKCFISAGTNEVLSTQFFILNKGLNSGKPSLNPCPNCFIITTANEQEKEFLFWLCWGLWQSKKFQFFLTGSVIPFIRLNEFKVFLKEQTAIAFAEKEQYQKNVKALQKLEALEKNYKQNLLLIMDAKRAIFQRETARR